MEGAIKKFFFGEVFTDEKTLSAYSHDASLFEVKPRLVAKPRDAKDVAELVSFVAEKKNTDSTISITARAAGTCMSGGSLNESIILDVNAHMQGIKEFKSKSVRVLPGTFYRDFEKETLKHGLILPCYTASKELCAIGGMIGNNAAGEKTLSYGKMENYIESLNVVFADGKEYEVKPLSRGELEVKMKQGDFEGNIYKKIWDLIQVNKKEIEENRPRVSKNSAGYYLWNVWSPESSGEKGRGVFDLTKLIVGSQGTLGIVTEARLRLVPVRKKSKLFVIFMKDLEKLGDLVNEILALSPESVESYDDDTLKLAIRFFPEMLKSMKATSLLGLFWGFVPEMLMVLRGGLPKLILLAEFAGDDEKEIDMKIKELERKVKPYNLRTRFVRSEKESEKYWTVRRESFSLLRKHVHGKRTAPFVDDVVVEPKHLPEFLPKMRKILDEYKLLYTIAGHAGNGNFHVIPLMDMKDKNNVNVITEVSDKIYDLVREYHGSITAEHNDGIVRTPYLGKMYSPRMLEIFQEIKNIFDPKNIFNPGKKVNGSVEYLRSHIATK
ncbi:MAG: hypothetical protein A3E93_00290 [Candidatus Zambryskibacteria bacterium RIFCSPHIGHO2_12_FULL_43_12b]|nr:MAG: hypothetical protein A3E93_00290 [Candidatus Zambryskibacteria bacterium RIFCSPHIGHO2_12_FULL_43_12b]